MNWKSIFTWESAKRAYKVASYAFWILTAVCAVVMTFYPNTPVTLSPQAPEIVLNADTLGRIKDGMSQTQVESILGPPRFKVWWGQGDSHYERLEWTTPAGPFILKMQDNEGEAPFRVVEIESGASK